MGAILAQLEGFEAPAGAWETEFCPRASASTNRPGSMSSASRGASSGRGWRRAAPTPSAARHRCGATPIALLARRNVRLWSSLTGTPDAVHLSAAAQRVAAYIPDARRLLL